jgi:eukaryotic-like serine/threonine-protein kinase
MRNSRLSLLVVITVVAIILVAGCTSSNQPSSSNQVTSTSTSTSAATSSSVASASPTVKPSASVSPSPSASPTATPTPAPSGSGRSATSIQFASVPSVSKSVPSSQKLGINVIASGIRICGHGTVTATIGTVSSGGSDCYSTAFLDMSSLNPGTYTVTLSYAGDSTYQSSQSTTQITVTA